jgi:hypothetical protein
VVYTRRLAAPFAVKYTLAILISAILSSGPTKSCQPRFQQSSRSLTELQCGIMLRTLLKSAIKVFQTCESRIYVVSRLGVRWSKTEASLEQCGVKLAI